MLVADIAGSTSIAEKLGPERSKFLFDDVVRLMRQEVERFGGTVAQLTGDGVLALFGAPIAHEDDSERAVRAALAIREALDGYAAEVAPSLRNRVARARGRQHGPGRRSGAATHRPTSSTTRWATQSTWRRACRRSAISSWPGDGAPGRANCSSSRSSATSS